MEKISSFTHVRCLNGWLEIKRINPGLEKIINIKISHIIYLSREGPFGDYDEEDSAINIWNVNIIVDRSGVTRTIIIPFETESDAESFLITVNSMIY